MHCTPSHTLPDGVMELVFVGALKVGICVQGSLVELVESLSQIREVSRSGKYADIKEVQDDWQG